MAVEEAGGEQVQEVSAPTRRILKRTKTLSALRSANGHPAGTGDAPVLPAYEAAVSPGMPNARLAPPRHVLAGFPELDASRSVEHKGLIGFPRAPARTASEGYAAQVAISSAISQDRPIRPR